MRTRSKSTLRWSIPAAFGSLCMFASWMLFSSAPASGLESVAAASSNADDAPLPVPLTKAAVYRVREPGAEGFVRSSASRSMRLTGRVMDVAAGPIDGVHVELFGRGSRGGAHGSIPPPTTTGSDGRFSLPFVPFAECRFELLFVAAARVDRTIAWRGLAPGEDLDFGDITMRRGCTVRGWVRDRRGQPRSGVRIMIGEESVGRVGELQHATGFQAVSGEDGAFEITQDVPFGRQRIEVMHAVLEDGQDHVIVAPGAEIDVIVVPDDEFATIRGIVVDAAGKPVADVEIETSPSIDASTWHNRTDCKGQFVIAVPPSDAVAPVRVRACKAGHTTACSPGEVEWGGEILRLILREQRGIQLTVVAAATGSAVEDFDVWIQPDIGSDVEDVSVCADRRHVEGRAFVGRIPAGRYLLKVIPSSATLLESTFLRIEVGAEVDAHVRVELERTASRPVRVERADGTPVVGATVELLESIDAQPVGVETRTVGRRATVRGGDAYVWHRGRTGAIGFVQVRGPRRSRLSLRVSGDGFPPTVQADVVLGSVSGPIIVQVDRGASIFGRIHPVSLLRPKGGSDGSSSCAPTLILKRGRCHLPASSVVRDDGTFEVSGIPPGTWTLSLLHPRSIGLRGVSMDLSELRVLRGLAAGERRRVDLALCHLVQGLVTGTVLVAGKPFAGELYLSDHARKRLDGSPDHRDINTRCDRDGRFRTKLLPGRYHARVLVVVAGKSRQLDAAETIVIDPSQDLARLVLRFQ